MRKLLIFIFGLFFLTICFISCDNSQSVLLYEQKTDDSVIDELPSEIPIEKALEKLDAFISSTNLSVTKSGNKRQIESVETHFSRDEAYTRSGVSLPDAYIVNFTDNNGFAVLGANTRMLPIIAVTEDGFLETGFLDLELDDSLHTIDDNGNVVNLQDFDPYSEEYDDYYVLSNIESDNQKAQKIFVQKILDNGITNGRTTNTSTEKVRYATKQSLIRTEWGQGNWDVQGVYNK